VPVMATMWAHADPAELGGVPHLVADAEPAGQPHAREWDPDGLLFSDPRWWTLVMRALSALLPVFAALVVAGCSNSGPVHVGKPAAPLGSARTVGCDQAIQQIGAPGGRILFGVLAVPPAQLERAVTTGSLPWAYFRKYGLSIRANSPAVLVTIPKVWRNRAAIGWGNDVGAVSSLRLLSCPRQQGAWSSYAGGFYLRSAAGCVPVVFETRRKTATVRFAIGRSCGT
jgi:hypothetical protein